MPHDTPLIATIVAGIGLAFVFGTIANRLRLSPLVGYLLAGVLIGPFTPGYVADQQLAPQLAEIGVILLMFGVGLHFSFTDLMAVRTIAVPGALVQIGIATALGMGLAWWLGWSVGAGLVFGLALSVASTVVLLRALQERRLVDTERGQIAVGWLIVEDLAMVLALVLLPAIAGLLGGSSETGTPQTGAEGLLALLEPETIWGVLALTILKVAAFVGLMLIVGRRVIPWILHYAAHTGSREIFRLAVLAIALGVAFGSAELFGVSFALGAFFAGMILAESQLASQAAQETLPLRDAFAVLFFVSVGMLFDPGIVVSNPMPVLATVLIIVVGKSVAAFLVVRAFGYSNGTAFTIAASLAQIGEFSFILAELGIGLKLLPEEGRDLILAGAILSILVNPFLFFLLGRFDAKALRRAAAAAPVEPDVPALPVTTLRDHAVLVGYGRVGSVIGQTLKMNGTPFLVIEEKGSIVEELRGEGVEVIPGAAGEPGLLKAANLKDARWLISAIANPFEASNLIEAGRKANPELEIIARAHSAAEVEHLRTYGANHIVLGELEIAREMANRLVRTSTAESPIHPKIPDTDARPPVAPRQAPALPELTEREKRRPV